VNLVHVIVIQKSTRLAGPCSGVGSANNNKLLLVWMQLREKYKAKFDLSSALCCEVSIYLTSNFPTKGADFCFVFFR
jgi:hypothetical protein